MLVEQDDNTVRFSMGQVFGVTALVALALSIASLTGSVTLGVHMSMCLAGWVMWRILHGHPAALIPVLLGADLLLSTGIEWGLKGEDFMFRGIILLIGTLLVLAGVGALVCIGTRKQRFWKHQYGVALAILCMLLAWWVVVPLVGGASVARRRASDTAANNQATAKAIAMVEEARQRTGTTPGEEALPGLLREPLPSVRWGGITGEIRYGKTGETTYELTYIDPSMLFGDIVIYDSAAPEKGWSRIPF